MTDIGHNGGPPMEEKTPKAGGIAGDQLKSIVERIERIEDEIAEHQEDRKEVYAEAKSNGFDVKTVRRVVALRKKDAAEREEEETMLDLYLHAMGMLGALE